MLCTLVTDYSGRLVTLLADAFARGKTRQTTGSQSSAINSNFVPGSGLSICV